MLHFGSFDRNLDSKNRLAIPKEVREAVREQEPELTGLHVTPWQGRCLAMFTPSRFKVLADALSTAPFTTDEVLDFQRLLFGVGRYCEFDGQGRLLLPEGLIQYVDVGRELVLTCVQDHLEIWDRKRWYSYVEERKPKFDSFAVAALQEARRSEVSGQRQPVD
jgi:transcriptional regulator MraZ